MKDLQNDTKEYTLIIGAMDIEIETIKSVMSNIEIIKKYRTVYYKGMLNNKSVILFKCGIGKINAAIATTVALENFNIKNIIFTGVAGSLSNTLNIGDVVISDSLVFHDFDLSATETSDETLAECFVPPIQADKYLIEQTKIASISIMEESKVHIGRIATGDQFVSGTEKIQSIAERTSALATEMEGASVAQVATIFEKPFVIIRSISDKADGSADIDFSQFALMAAKNSADIVVKMMESM